MLNPGTKLGPYELIGSLGAGGMGQVYRARDTRLHRDVAIKVLQESVAGAAAWERFQREARAASALNHPHICAVYDVGEADGQPFLVMELVEGQTLRDYVGATKPDLRALVDIAIQIADALDAAHRKGVIHRDIKPGNIMIAGGRHVKVLDFGLAKYVVVANPDETRAIEPLTQIGSIVGTPQYLAPEVLQGHPADVRSDLWAFGVVLYEMLSNRVPFTGPTPYETGAAILRESTPPLGTGVPAGLRALVERCLAKRPDDRYQTAADVRHALEQLQSPPTTAFASSRKALKWPAAVAAVVLLAAAVVVWQRRPAPDLPRTVTGAPASKNQEANDAFALAMQFMRVQNNAPRAQQQLELALRLDPHFAEARRFHALNYVVSFLNGYTNDTALLYKAEEELREAQRDDPGLASLPSAFTAVYMAQGRKEMIPAALFERASGQDAAARDAQLWRVIISWLAGENDGVKTLTQSMLVREPLFGAARMFLGEALRVEGDINGAIREQRRVLEQAPDNVSAVWWLTLAYLDADQLRETRALLEEKRGPFERNYLWRTAWGLLLAREGKRAEALEAMDVETLKYLRAAFVATLGAAEFYALLGDTARALEWFETAVRNGDERVVWFRKDPRLASIRDDPRFVQILQSIEARRQQRH